MLFQYATYANCAPSKEGLDSGLYSRVYLGHRSQAHADWHRREEDWTQRGCDSLLRTQRLTPTPSSDAGRFPEVRRNRCRDSDLCPPRTGPGIQAQRDPRTFETERGSPAALCAGAATVAEKIGRRTSETHGSSQVGTRTSFGAALLQEREAQTASPLSNFERWKP